MKRNGPNGYFIFLVVDSCGVHSDENIKSGTILSFDVVCICYKKVNKQV